MAERGPGVNFTDRQRIKRKAARWAAKIARLRVDERRAVIAAVLKADPQLSLPIVGIDYEPSLLPGSGVTKLSPRDSAEPGGQPCL
jgi:hypothetical protein